MKLCAILLPRASLWAVLEGGLVDILKTVKKHREASKGAVYMRNGRSSVTFRFHAILAFSILHERPASITFLSNLDCRSGTEGDSISQCWDFIRNLTCQSNRLPDRKLQKCSQVGLFPDFPTFRLLS
jgi:hypothetical protein